MPDWLAYGLEWLAYIGAYFVAPTGVLLMLVWLRRYTRRYEEFLGRSQERADQSLAKIDQSLAQNETLIELHRRLVTLNEQLLKEQAETVALLRKWAERPGS
jgi:hypothetical protein